MTSPSEQIAVSQAAREAAAKAYESIADCTIPLNFPARVRAGEPSELAQAFARFEAETLERVAKVCDDRARWHEESFRKDLVLKNDDRQTHFAARNREAKEIATAIRALKGSGHG